jgi:hypothetical protein
MKKSVNKNCSNNAKNVKNVKNKKTTTNRQSSNRSKQQNVGFVTDNSDNE